VEIAGLTLSQTAGVTWGYTFATVDDFELVPAGSGNGQYTDTDDPVEAQDPSGTVGPEGETIYLRMILDHGNLFEGIAESTYDLAVNGILLDDLGNPITNGEDIHHVDPCDQVDFDDIAYQKLIPRPDVQSVNPPPPGYLPIGN
jgi:hypothetical protein